MAKLDLGVALEGVLNKLVAEMEREGMELAYNVQAYASVRGLKATVQLSLTAKGKLCPKCGKQSTAPMGDWRNDPDNPKGVRYVCPDCAAQAKVPA